MPETKSVLVIGSLNIDLVAHCERLPQGGQTVFGHDFLTAAGGKGANQAVAAARLSARVAMAGCVGCDQFGNELVTGLRDAGVRTDSVMTVDRPTGTAVITVDATGANTIVVIPGANAACDPALVDAALAAETEPGILLLQHEIPEAANDRAVRAAHAAGWFIILNPAPARPVPRKLLPLIGIIAPNETEAAALTGRPVTDRSSALAAARHLREKGARAVLVTLGGAGALLCHDAGALFCPAVPVQPVDTTAAGDAYLGALASALAAGRTLPDSLGCAAVAASCAVTRLGAQPSLPSAAEVTAAIARHGVPATEAIA